MRASARRETLVPLENEVRPEASSFRRPSPTPDPSLKREGRKSSHHEPVIVPLAGHPNVRNEWKGTFDSVDLGALAIHDARMTKPSVFPVDFELLLASIGQRLENGESIAAELPAAIAGISALPAIAISQAAPAIANTAKLYRWRSEPSLFEALFRRRLTDKEQLFQLPDLEYLFLFHLDGRIREASLQRITGGLPSPFLFAAVALRLNDWVEQVREAALACANRCFPLTSPDVVAGAAAALLLRQHSWGRWGKEREAIDAAFTRTDVATRLAADLVDAQTGPASRILRFVLKHDAIDHHLERLSAEAKQPSVRALAVQTIADKRASWPAGMEYRWVDKSMGLRTRVPRFEFRDISLPLAGARVIRAAASDKSAVVRRASLDALIRHRLGSEEAQELALRLKADVSPSVRERADFILSRHAELAASSDSD